MSAILTEAQNVAQNVFESLISCVLFNKKRAQLFIVLRTIYNTISVQDIHWGQIQKTFMSSYILNIKASLK